MGTTWSHTTATLPDGTYTATVAKSDLAGNIGSGGPMTFTVDTHVPVVSIEPPGPYVNTATPILKGADNATDGPIALTIYNGSSVGGTVAEAASVPNTGATWTHTSAHLADGTYTAQATQESGAGTKGVSAPVTFIVDTVAPVVTLNKPTSPTSNPTPQLSGSAGNLSGDLTTVTVTILEAEVVVAGSSTVAIVGGKWTYTPAALFDGEYTIKVTQSDKAGNVSIPATASIVIDTNAPAVTIDPPQSPTNQATPTLTGSAEAGAATVRVKIHAGKLSGKVVAEGPTVPVTEGRWSYTPSSPLAQGTYTARAEEENGAKKTGASVPVEFAIDTTPPAVTITQPSSGALSANGEPQFAGSAGEAEGDQNTVALKIYPGTATSGTPVQSAGFVVNHGEWSGGTGVALANGLYTAVAQQRDDAGNVGAATTTFAVIVTSSASTATPPTAAFRWFPTNPHIGEPVSLVSTSNAGSSQLTGFSWSLNGGASFTGGAAVFSTTFTTAGPHAVRLLVTDANGLTSSVGQTINVTKAPAVLMQPFPVVRIAGSGGAGSVHISLFTVLAPRGARISVSCRGPGCPTKLQSLVASTHSRRHHAGTVLVSFTRFERRFGAGAVLEIRVWRAGQIGKYTRFQVRRGKLPLRDDKCLTVGGVKPMNCPS